MATDNAAKVTMNRINLAFARYESELFKLMRDETVPHQRLEDAIREGVIVEENYHRCRVIYENDPELFLKVCGDVHLMDDADILHNLLLCEEAARRW